MDPFGPVDDTSLPPLSTHLLSRLDESFESRNKPLRIAIVTENWLPKVDGVTRTLARLLKHLREQGHEAILLGPRSNMCEFEGHAIVGTQGIPLPSYPGLALNFLRPLFLRRLISFRPDVVHFVDPIWLGGQALPAIEHFLPECGLVSSFQTNLSAYAGLYGFGFLERAMWAIQRYLHGRCALTFCPSPSTARMLSDRGFDNLRIWSRGADTVLFNPAKRDPALRSQWARNIAPSPPSADDAPPPTDLPADHELVLLFVGRIAWEKNLRVLVEAFRGLEAAYRAALPDSTTRIRLVFVGDGPARADIAALCASHGLRTLFMGHREGADLARCYASADVFAFPSWTETFGQVVLEALSAGIPVVGLRAEGVRDLVQHGKTGLLLDLDALIGASESAPADPRAVCDPSSPAFERVVAAYRTLLLQLLVDADRRRAMGLAAVVEASTRSWHAEMENLVEGYRDVREFSARRRERRIHQLASRTGSVALTRSMSISSDVSTAASSDFLPTPATSPALAPQRVEGSGKFMPSRLVLASPALRAVDRFGLPRIRRPHSPAFGPRRGRREDEDADVEDIVLDSERKWRRSAALNASLVGRAVFGFWAIQSLGRIAWRAWVG